VDVADLAAPPAADHGPTDRARGTLLAADHRNPP
jgi:hypothetical protein